MDKIKISNLELYCYHGVYKEENKLGQKFSVSATLYTDTKKAAESDDLSYSIDYGQVCYDIKRIMEENTYKLIETIADKLAKELLLKYNEIEKIDIQIKKPYAPIQLPFEYVSVEIQRKWNKAYIGLGSNLGNKQENIKKAIDLISNNKECLVLNISDLIITEPIGDIEQDKFLNGCLEIKTLKSPLELLKLLNKIENELGRVRTIKWGPRIIDLDILLYEDIIIESEDLTIPHKEMLNRGFVLIPLAQIAPNVIHPILRENIYCIKNKFQGE